MKILKYTLWLFFITTILQSCGDDTPQTPIVEKQEELLAPSERSVKVAQDKGVAIISGKVNANTEVSLKYNYKNGGLLKTTKSDKAGNFSFEVNLLRDFSQNFVIFSSRKNKTVTEKSEKIKVETIPQKSSKLGLIKSEIKEKITAHRWKSVQNKSWVIIQQTAPIPPYEIFVTRAQKYFEFVENGKFNFEVTSPLQFQDNKGNWVIDENLILTINTTIPLGAMRLKNIRIQALTDTNLVLLTDIADGVFVITLSKE